MVEFLEAILLGVVQGLTEFLPVSSSGHLLLAQHFLGVNQDRFGLPFDAAIQSGTLLAVLSYFRRDFLRMAGSILKPRAGGELGGHDAASRDRRMAVMILAATVPAGLAGLAFEEEISGVLRSPWVVVASLVIVGALFVAAESLGRKTGSAEKLTLPAALAVGLAQATALVPGVSRSGATMAMGLFLGLRREEAARFSFMMSVPIISLAAAYSLAGALERGMGPAEAGLFAVGIASSAVVGYWTIRFLLVYLAAHSLRVFAYYRFALAAVVALALLGSAGR